MGDAGDHAREDFTDMVFEQLEQFDLPELALGIVAAAFGKAQMFAEFDQLIERWRIIKHDFLFAFLPARVFGFFSGGKVAV